MFHGGRVGNRTTHLSKFHPETALVPTDNDSADASLVRKWFLAFVMCAPELLVGFHDNTSCVNSYRVLRLYDLTAGPRFFDDISRLQTWDALNFRHGRQLYVLKFLLGHWHHQIYKINKASQNCKLFESATRVVSVFVFFKPHVAMPVAASHPNITTTHFQYSKPPSFCVPHWSIHNVGSRPRCAEWLHRTQRRNATITAARSTQPEADVEVNERPNERPNERRIEFGGFTPNNAKFGTWNLEAGIWSKAMKSAVLYWVRTLHQTGNFGEQNPPMQMTK